LQPAFLLKYKNQTNNQIFNGDADLFIICTVQSYDAAACRTIPKNRYLQKVLLPKTGDSAQKLQKN